jgi:hypothetical protein
MEIPFSGSGDITTDRLYYGWIGREITGGPADSDIPRFKQSFRQIQTVFGETNWQEAVLPQWVAAYFKYNPPAKKP